MEIKIIIPTYKRAGIVTTLDHVANAALCVTESEREVYRRHYPKADIIVHPDSIIGLAMEYLDGIAGLNRDTRDPELPQRNADCTAATGSGTASQAC